jgi:chromosome segregation protein
MKLKALKLHGFKSFADSTEVEFHDGITAVVGPNGCGKSNISDAIRWVLGEQRPTAIRGAKMEEAIFQGSVNRRPVNRGTVSLVVSNEDGSLPVPFEEVELGRTVYRDGGSDYSINRTSCRLKDVTEMCRDTGLGANAYAIIENRMIDAILSDRAEERRGLFEEAAGIGKYKDRRKAASRRLERAELDLQRLDDVIAEVETKVRSLSRQKGKAQRYQTLRDRRLAVEVAVVRLQLQTLKSRLNEVQRELAGDRELGEGYVAELQSAETQFETLRIRQVEAEKARVEAAQNLEKIRQQLVKWERDLAVAEERATYAGRRLSQIEEEQEELGSRVAVLEGEEKRTRGAEEALSRELEALQEEKRRRAGSVKEARDALERAREQLDKLESRHREVTRRKAHLEGEATSAEAQAAELTKHLERLQREVEEASSALSDVANQGDLFADRLTQLKVAVDGAQSGVVGAKEKTREGREGLQNVRDRAVKAGEAVSSLEARIDALEGMERAQEGLEPTVKAALALKDEGILGTLGDSLGGDPAVVRAVESYLGPLVQGLVVKDGETVSRLLDWYERDWGDRGGLILFPLDRANSEAVGQDGSLLAALTLEGAGTPWVKKLLGGIALEREGRISSSPQGMEVLSLAGGAVDRFGIVRLGSPLGTSGILERREQVKLLKKDLLGAQTALEAEVVKRGASEAAAAEGDQALEDAWGVLRDAEDAFRSASSEAQAQSDRKDRLDRHQEELARQVEGTRAARDRALERAKGAREDKTLLSEEAENYRESEGTLRDSVAAAQEGWEEARAYESQVTLELARKEGDHSRFMERLADLQTSLNDARGRISALTEEEDTLKAEEASVKTLKEEGGAATEALFGERDEAETALRQKDEASTLVTESLQEADRRVRTARAEEREALDQRHRMELEEQELTGRIGRIQDRLEGEWGRPLEVLLAEAEPVEGEPDELRDELREIVEKLDKIGPVNMLAVEEHQEESARLEFLHTQRGDLKKARDDLRAAIKQINETATQLFLETFEKIRENFRNTFLRLFEGGEVDLWMEEDADPLESVIEIHASPRGKKTQRIDLLSGGERALTALSLLFGIYLVKPSPFCVLDEVDAPLDESNIYRFIRLLQEFKEQTQFIVITHNARTIEAADWIYGVTMEEPGVSRIVGVQLEEALKTDGTAA